MRTPRILLAAITSCAWLAFACTRGPAPEAPAAPAGPAVKAAAPLPWTAAAIAHGGVGTPPDKRDGVRRAVDVALSALERGDSPVDAAVLGVAVMEDDPRYNAGTGSRIRIDGETIQMDASAMSSDGRFGAVAAIERVKNPVFVARAVMDTPHLVLAGDGATRFARSLGLPDYDPATPEMRAATSTIQAQLRRGDGPKIPPEWKEGFNWRARWNFERSLEQAGLGPSAVGSDTVGVAVRAKDGRFAVALSTGGTAVTLRGRVGDVPILGAGLFANGSGAAAATGVGERIIEAQLAREVVGWLAAGVGASEAAERAVREIKDRGAIGIVVIGPTELAAAADRPMAWAARESGSKSWSGP